MGIGQTLLNLIDAWDKRYVKVSNYLMLNYNWANPLSWFILLGIFFSLFLLKISYFISYISGWISIILLIILIINAFSMRVMNVLRTIVNNCERNVNLSKEDAQKKALDYLSLGVIIEDVKLLYLNNTAVYSVKYIQNLGFKEDHLTVYVGSMKGNIFKSVDEIEPKIEDFDYLELMGLK